MSNGVFERKKEMAKVFERANLSQNDDGSYTIGITPVRKKSKNKSGEVMTTYEDEKTYTAATLDEAMKKIQGYGGKPEKDPKGELDDWMNPDRGMEEETDVEQ